MKKTLRFGQSGGFLCQFCWEVQNEQKIHPLSYLVVLKDVPSSRTTKY